MREKEKISRLNLFFFIYVFGHFKGGKKNHVCEKKRKKGGRKEKELRLKGKVPSFYTFENFFLISCKWVVIKVNRSKLKSDMAKQMERQGN